MDHLNYSSFVYSGQTTWKCTSNHYLSTACVKVLKNVIDEHASTGMFGECFIDIQGALCACNQQGGVT